MKFPLSLCLLPLILAGCATKNTTTEWSGDEVVVRGRDFYINGRFVGQAKTHDQKGAAVQMSTSGLIPPDKYFVVTPHRDSFDSRYALVGLIDRKALIGKAYPVL
ncbi:S26 family signal peptidase [Asticcacaulis sp. AND118]|uniref:S26 family signal peptidase n=1 Tax=Asticcacaulis sp. AND118 TaxID=2840468 RepID=UPI001CFF73BA|nr:S26 family signal peptidase [Asticcacaulis sp. AND118]UDF05765.1 S26 family signal peptidase [Asticcacaulis sp. AND118]